MIFASDDVLGFPSALLFAGASAVISTLWPTDPDGGANLPTEFYHAFHMQRVEKDEKSADQESGLKGCVNLAHAIHRAVNILRQRGEEKNAPYHWAVFYLIGFWLFPPLAIK